MQISGIYKIQSIIKPKRVYIGSSKNIIGRWNVHIRELRKNKHRNTKLQNHFNKYGIYDLSFSVIAICDKKELIPVNNIIWLEECFIIVYKPYFNINPHAGSCIGVKRNKKTRDKMSVAKKGYTPSLEHIENVRKAKIGKPRSLETREKISKKMKGLIRSEENRYNLSKSKIGDKNPMYGKSGEKNPFWGKKHSKDTIDKIRKERLKYTEV